MDTPTLSSPECGPLVTNKDRKRKRTTSVQAQFDSDASTESKQTISAQSSLEKPDTKPARKRANIRDLNPKTPSRNNTEKAKSNRKYGRRVSSTTKMGAESSIKKFESKDKPVDNDDDDDVSVAGSNVSTGRLRRSEAERIQYFENQSECGKMEPHQVHCLRCNKPVNLGRKQTYTVRPWEIHRARCDQRPHVVLTAPNAKVEPTPESQSTPARRPSEQERKEFLEADVQIEKVEGHRVLCHKCQGWVDLGQNAYATGNWVKHKAWCSVPSNRVTAAQRRLVLVNDAQAKSFDHENVECTLCGAQIRLEGEGDFNLIKWNEHKSACTKSGPIFKKDTVNSIPFPTQPCRPPLSSASTEDTLIVDSYVQGLKRPREEPDHLPHEEMPKVVRPRTDSYLPTAIEPPDSILGWFMMPIHSFVRGFKESVRDQS